VEFLDTTKNPTSGGFQKVSKNVNRLSAQRSGGARGGCFENAHTVRKKTVVFYCGCYMYNDWRNRTAGLCEPLWSVRLNCQLMTMHILQAQVCGCDSAHPRLPHLERRREASDASKSQLNCKIWHKSIKD